MQAIEFSVDDGVATITLNRPRQKNAIDEPMAHELADTISRVRDDNDIRALVITGAGGAFCAGGDIRGMVAARDDPPARRDRLARIHVWVEQLIHLDKPVIAAVDGPAFGAGFGLALAADMVIASRRACFCMAFMKVGLVPDFGALYTLPRVVGLQRAREIIYSARTLDAEEARTLGIVLEIHAPDALMGRVQAIARSMTAASPTAFALTKRALNVSLNSDLRSMLNLEFSSQNVAFATREHSDAIDAFLGGQPPKFRWPE